MYNLLMLREKILPLEVSVPLPLTRISERTGIEDLTNELNRLGCKVSVLTPKDLT